MLLMVEKNLSGGICHSIYRYAKVNNKYMEDYDKHRDIKLVTSEKRRNYLASEPNYHTTKFFTEHLLAIEMKKKTNTYK